VTAAGTAGPVQRPDVYNNATANSVANVPGPAESAFSSYSYSRRLLRAYKIAAKVGKAQHSRLEYMLFVTHHLGGLYAPNKL